MASRRHPYLLVALTLLLPLAFGCQQEAQETILLRQLTNQNANQRWSAALAIRDSGVVASELIPPLVKALDDEDSRVRVAAAEAIGAAGPNAREHLPALVKLANSHQDLQVRAALNDAVIKINSPQ